MNYLAHIYLARENDQSMLGALLGDFVKADITGKFGRDMEREILIHRKVDGFTDSHPVVKTALQQFDAGRRRYAGIVLDVFYDHVLAQNWSTYCAVPLADFIQGFYRVLQHHQSLLPERLAVMAPRMIEQDWLGSYREFSGVETAIVRMSGRLSRNGHLLREGLLDLRENYASLCQGFHTFFPELIRFAEDQRVILNEKQGATA